MTCGLQDGIDIHFLRSDIHLSPYEVTTRSNQKEFSYTKCVISRDDGKHVSESADEYEPVLLRFDGHIQDRYMFHPEAIDLHKDDADLTLYDAEKVLEQGSLNHYFSNSTLGEVMTFAIENRDDPNNAITGIEHPSGVEDAKVFNELTGGDKGAFSFLKQKRSEITNTVRSMEESDTSIRIDKQPPAAAVKKASNQFGLETWVDKDGVFQYGLAGAGKERFTVKPNDKEKILKEYNVTIGSGKVSQVILHGELEYTVRTASENKFPIETGVNSYGRAYLVDSDGNAVDGRTITPENKSSAGTPDAVEQTARATLMGHYMDRKNGNIIINSGASTDIAGLTEITVGDLVGAKASIKDHCTEEIDTGIYLVQSVKHNINQRQGWLTTIEVSGMPFADIQSEGWIEHPKNDKTWDDLKEYTANNPANVVEDG